MDILNIINEAVDTIREIPYLAEVPVFSQDSGSVDADMRLKLAQGTVCVMVGWNGFTPQIQGSTAPNADLFGTVGIVASVFERPLTNRAQHGAKTIMNIAREIAKALNCAAAEGMDAPLFLKRISPISELDSGSDNSTVMCSVEFETKTSL